MIPSPDESQTQALLHGTAKKQHCLLEIFWLGFWLPVLHSPRIQQMFFTEICSTLKAAQMSTETPLVFLFPSGGPCGYKAPILSAWRIDEGTQVKNGNKKSTQLFQIFASPECSSAAPALPHLEPISIVTWCGRSRLLLATMPHLEKQKSPGLMIFSDVGKNFLIVR